MDSPADGHRRCSRAVLLCLLAPLARASLSCKCSGVSNQPERRSDYGAFCASWDAVDERPWCAVVSRDACGEGRVFESASGKFWSHQPCEGVAAGPPPPVAAASQYSVPEGALGQARAAASDKKGKWQLHLDVDAANSGGSQNLGNATDVWACQNQCANTPGCSSFAFKGGFCTTSESSVWAPRLRAGVVSGKLCPTGQVRAAAPIPFGSAETLPRVADWPKPPVSETVAKQAVEKALSATVRRAATAPLSRVSAEPHPQHAAWAVEAFAYLDTLHQRPCNHDTPMLSYIVPNVGFGNQIVQVILHFAQAVVQRRSFVLVWPQQASWFAPKYQLADLVHESSCQKYVKSHNESHWKAHAGQFKDHRPTAYLRCHYEAGNEWDNSDIEVPERFASRPLTWWYRMLTTYLVRPSARVLSSSRALLPQQAWLHKVSNTRAAETKRPPDGFAQDYAAQVATLRDVKRPLVGVHIRGGDACADNRRPTVCISFDNALRHLRTNGITSGSLIVSTDDEAVAKDAARFSGTFNVMVLDLDRRKLKSDVFVEARTNLNRVRVFEEMWAELGLLVQADVLLGSFYSNFARVALQLSVARSYIPLDALWCPYCLCQLNMPLTQSGDEYSSDEWQNKMYNGVVAELTREHIFKDGSSVPLLQHATGQFALVNIKTGCYPDPNAGP